MRGLTDIDNNGSLIFRSFSVLLHPFIEGSIGWDVSDAVRLNHKVFRCWDVFKAKRCELDETDLLLQLVEFGWLILGAWEDMLPLDLYLQAQFANRIKVRASEGSES